MNDQWNTPAAILSMHRVSGTSRAVRIRAVIVVERSIFEPNGCVLVRVMQHVRESVAMCVAKLN